MDYLDPRKKRRHLIQLYIGYVLMAIAIFLSTLVFVYQAKGYDLDRKSGEIVQNGLVFIDSQPAGATITLNGEKHRDTTDARLVLKEGQYDLTIEKEGYTTWRKTFTLGGGSIERFSYSFLYPLQPTEKIIDRFDTLPTLTSISPDKHWLLVLAAVDANGYTFKLYDLTKQDQAPKSIVVSQSHFKTFNPAATLQLTEWADDNRHFVLRYDNAEDRQFVLVDRANPQNVVNMNTVFAANPTQVSLFDKTVEKVYLYDAKTKVVSLGNLVEPAPVTPLIKDVLAYKTHGGDTIMYVSAPVAGANTAQVYIRKGDSAFKVRDIPYAAAEPYLVDVARYDGHWYYVVGTQSEGKIYVYKDAKQAANNQDLAYLTVLRVENPLSVSFSTSARNLAVQGGNRVVVQDFEMMRQYRFALNDTTLPAGYVLRWLDGDRLGYVADGVAGAIDFDGENQQRIISEGVLGEGLYFDRSFSSLMLYRSVAGGTQVSLSAFDMTIDQ